MKKLSIIALVTLFLAGIIGSAKAADFRYATNQNGSVTISQSDATTDLHVVAQTVTVSNNVGGDLLAAGSDITVSGNVQNSSFLVGGSITTTGNVGHHLRVAGNTVTIAGTITGDVYAAGSDVSIQPSAVITGSLYVAASTLTINGTVKGGVWARTADIVINGSVGSVHAQTSTIEIQSQAIVNGDLTYSAPTSAVIDSAARITGLTKYTVTTATARGWWQDQFSFGRLLVLLGSMLLLWLITLLWPRRTSKAITNFYTNPFKNFLIGLGLLVVGPGLVIASFISLVGMGIAIFAGTVWLTLLVLATVLAPLALGSWLVGKLTKEGDDKPLDWQAIVVGVLIYEIIGFIPILGGLVKFVLVVIGFGALASQTLKRDGKAN